jgi:DNA-binding MarR family transcriptional regulator
MTAEQVDPQAAQVRDLLLTLVERIGALNEAQVCCHNISYPEYRVLTAVQSQEELTLGELAAYVGLSPSGLTRLLDRLSGKGYATRVADSGDARASRVRVTEQGARLLEVIGTESVTYMQRLLNEMPEPMRPLVASALQSLLQAEQRLAAQTPTA